MKVRGAFEALVPAMWAGNTGLELGCSLVLMLGREEWEREWECERGEVWRALG